MSNHVIEHIQDSQNPPTSTTSPGTIVFNTFEHLVLEELNQEVYYWMLQE
jgi:hypothetical protein